MDANYDYPSFESAVVNYKVTYFNPETNQAASQPSAVTIDFAGLP